MTQYSVKTGLWKTIKNVAVVMGIPAVLYLLDGYTQWMPKEYWTIAAPAIAFVSYFIKNYLENRGK